MATAAQQRSAVRLDHPTHWTAVIDPPGEFAYSVGFPTEDDARAFAERQPCSDVLPPRTR